MGFNDSVGGENYDGVLGPGRADHIIFVVFIGPGFKAVLDPGFKGLTEQYLDFLFVGDAVDDFLDSGIIEILTGGATT